MKILFIGDVFSEAGRSILSLHLKDIKRKHSIDFTIINGENIAHGYGINDKMYLKLLELGADCITLGNHFLTKDATHHFLDEANKLVRPANIHDSIKGKGSRVFIVNNVPVRVTNLLGRTFIKDLNPTNPFDKIDEILKESNEKIHFIDFHGEATSEKLALAWYLDGKVSAVIGTHTHVPTADERILPNGLAYQSDVGMTGPYNGIIGAKKDNVIEYTRTGIKTKFDVEPGPAQLNGVVIEIDNETGKALSIQRINIAPDKVIGL